MKHSRPATLSWCLYDLANTIFAIHMTSYHFPVWLTAERGMAEFPFALAFGGSTLAAALLMPGLGRRADRRGGGRVAGLVLWTLACVAWTGSLSFVDSAVVALGIFCLANFSYQLAGIFYNALLPAVAPAQVMGRVSGWGVALGYVGTLIGITAVAPVVARWGRQSAFLATAILFFVLALPSFFIREGSRPNGPGPQPGRPGPQPDRLAHREQAEGSERLVHRFLRASFWGLCAVSAVLLFMSVYAKKAVGMSDEELHWFLIVSTLFAIGGSLGWGWLTERWGGYASLGWVWTLWAVTLTLALVSFHRAVFWVVGALAGTALGGTWVTSRVLLVEWMGQARAGEAFGRFGLVSRLAGLVGPAVWGAALWAAAPLGMWRYRLAVGALLVFVLVGCVLYHRVRR